MDPIYKADTAPGEPHIALRQNGKCFYSPSLFHLAPTHDHIVPMMISDVLRSKCLLEVYGVTGMKMHFDGYIMVNNYPVQLVKIRGRVLLFSEVHHRNKAPFYYISIEDYLGSLLTIVVKASINLFELVLKENDVIEVVGKVSFQPHRTIIRANTAISKGKFHFELELDWWETVFSARQYLEKPWKYVALTHSAEPGAVRFAMSDQIKQKQKRDILFDNSDDDGISTTATFNGATDSFVVNKPRRAHHQKLSDRVSAKKRVDSYTFVIVSDEESI